MVKPRLLLLLVNSPQIQMLQLTETVLEQDVLGLDELLPRVLGVLELNWGWLVLQACHLEGFHHSFVLVARCASLAILVEVDHVYRFGDVSDDLYL